MERRVTVEDDSVCVVGLNTKEVEILKAVHGAIGGPPEGPRRYIDSIYDKLPRGNRRAPWKMVYDNQKGYIKIRNEEAEMRRKKIEEEISAIENRVLELREELAEVEACD